MARFSLLNGRGERNESEKIKKLFLKKHFKKHFKFIQLTEKLIFQFTFFTYLSLFPTFQYNNRVATLSGKS